VFFAKTPSGGFSPAGVLGVRQAGFEERLNDERDGDVAKDKEHGNKPGNPHDWPQGEPDQSVDDSLRSWFVVAGGSLAEYRRRVTQPRATRSGDAARRCGATPPPSR
jgi:hypothetical protein